MTVIPMLPGDAYPASGDAEESAELIEACFAAADSSGTSRGG